MAKDNLPVVHVINGRQKKLLQGHLRVGTVIHNDAGLLLIQDIGHEHHGYGIGTDLVCVACDGDSLEDTL